MKKIQKALTIKCKMLCQEKDSRNRLIIKGCVIPLVGVCVCVCACNTVKMTEAVSEGSWILSY